MQAFYIHKIYTVFQHQEVFRTVILISGYTIWIHRPQAPIYCGNDKCEEDWKSRTN